MDANFKSYPALWLVPGIGLVMPLIVALGLRSRREWLACWAAAWRLPASS
jgi:cytochrome d ubiquinol oxidase subunit II